MKGDCFIMDYQILVNKTHKLDDEYLKTTIIPQIVEVDPMKNNEIVYRTFGIKEHATFLEKKTAEQFEKLRVFARENGIILGITSGYLSLEQQGIKYEYFVRKKGIEFAQKSACLPGYSEHNTGLAMDCDIFRNGRWAGIALDENGNINQETAWLHSVLPKFGFILRYPKGKESITGMKFEPWHIRYVGEELAEYLTSNNLTMEEYYESKSEKN